MCVCVCVSVCVSLLLLTTSSLAQMSSQEAKDATSLEVFLHSQLEELRAYDSPSVKGPGEVPMSPKSPGEVPSTNTLELLSPPGDRTRRGKVSKCVVGQRVCFDVGTM